MMASGNTRFFNFCVDVFIYFLLFKLSAKACVAAGILLNLKWFAIALYVAYYFVFEYFFYKTPAKWLTKTKVVLLKPTSQKAVYILIRSLVRLLPIDLFSYLFTKNGLHDRWSFTQTITIHQSNQAST